MESPMDQWLDVLSPRRHSSDLLWIAFHDWKCSPYKFSKQRTPEQIREDVFTDPVIQSLMRQKPRLKTRIDKILTEMSHDFSLRSVRFVGYFLTKIMKSIYRSIQVNNHLVMNSSSPLLDNSLTSTLSSLAKESPILYVPTHRSYADFLIFAFVCFSLDLPMPSIAAGIDFLALNQIASLLRSCGAFYIRRSFKNSDVLYWHVFRAYLKSQMCGGERPLEFFIEGTRSRSGKSLYPRTGLLGVALELYFTGQIPNLTIIPVSISYDRVLEEGLYAKELLPTQDYTGKPAETPQHLLSGAKAILSQDFGSVYIRFCQPISVGELANAQHLRQCHSLDSKFDPNPSQTQEELDFILDLSKTVIKAQQMNFVFSPFTFASMVFLTYFDCNHENDVSIPMSLLLEDIEALSALLNARNLSFDCTQNCLQKQLLESFNVHSNIVRLSEDRNSVIVNTSEPMIGQQLRQYANQSMQLLIDFAIYLYSGGDSYKFKRIKWLLSREFIYKSSELNDSYILSQFLNRMPLTERIQKVLVFQIDYYLKNYLSLAEWLSQNDSSLELPIDVKSLVKSAQKVFIFPSDLIQNCFSILVTSKALSRDSDLKLRVISSNLNDMINELSQLSHYQSEPTLESYANFKLKANL